MCFVVYWDFYTAALCWFHWKLFCLGCYRAKYKKRKKKVYELLQVWVALSCKVLTFCSRLPCSICISFWQAFIKCIKCRTMWAEGECANVCSETHLSAYLHVGLLKQIQVCLNDVTCVHFSCGFTKNKHHRYIVAVFGIITICVHYLITVAYMCRLSTLSAFSISFCPTYRWCDQLVCICTKLKI